MSYRGNPSLASDVKTRIVDTFRQTLELAAAGSVHEATLGCDFILRMDPDFEPARTLAGRLEGAAGPVKVDDLTDSDAGAGAGAGEPSAAELFDELDDLDLGQSGAPAKAPADLLPQLDQRLAERDFAGVLELARGAEGDPEVARRVTTARERQEAAPYVQRFLDAARTALAAGDSAAARGHLDKAASLDPAHPGVAELQPQLGPAGGGGAPAAPAPAVPPAARPSPARPATAPPAAPGDRIGELLAEGQAAYESGAYQDAIDAWSRIFLIDVDHEEASQRIEEARRLKAEQERQVEEVFHEALTHLESGERESARRGFEKVLEMHPGHLAARERLEELESGGGEAGAPAAMPAPPTAAETPLRPPAGAAKDDRVLKEEILVPPEPGEARPAPAPAAPTQAAAARPGRRFVLIGSLVLVLAVAALAFLWLNRERFFPNAQQQVSAGDAGDPIARATALHEGGKTELALNLLRRIPDGAPQYEEAQALISQWEASDAPAAGQDETPAGPSARELALRDEDLTEGRQAYADREYLRALERFDAAAEIAPLGEPEATLRADAEDLLAPLASELAMFREGEYEFALRSLWRLREEHPDDRVIERLIVDSYYNLAVRDLQRGDAEAAVEKLEEILALRPDDLVAERHLQFARSYQRREMDLLYRIYVKYLPSR